MNRSVVVVGSFIGGVGMVCAWKGDMASAVCCAGLAFLLCLAGLTSS